MTKRKRKLTAAEKAAKKRRKLEYMTIFRHGKMKRVKRPPTIDGLSGEEFIPSNAGPIWYHREEGWEEMPGLETGSFSGKPSPELVTDIRTLEALARDRDEENWEFRNFLKNADLKVEEIDAIVRRIYREVSGQISCLDCGHCCRAISPILSPEEVSRLAQIRDLTEQEFIDRYLAKGAGGFLFRLPCPFQSGNACTVYEDRPENCRSYPHLHKPDFVFHIIRALGNYSVCPIAFNVWERLKREISIRTDNRMDEEIPF